MKKNIEQLKTENGFTLIELLIGMTILIIMLAAILGILSVTIKSQQYNFDESANIQDERQILINISNEIRNATNISSPAAGGTMNAISYQKSGDTKNRTISVGTGNNANTIIFTDTTGAIVQTMGMGRTQLLQFTRGDGTNYLIRRITINLTMQNAARANAPQNSISTVVYTLN